MRRIFIILALLLMVSACAKQELSEKDRYVNANVEIACYFLRSQQSLLDINQSKIEQILAKHGFTMDQLEADSKKFNDDVERDISEKILEACPYDSKIELEEIQQKD